ncbi:alpha/beta hydrolase [Sphingopyxis sp. MWB1]|uniref:alpha/beta hydrolase n=1 Tax=Sphingopyxis sp. MWB1 TaxID=1537715 RepID=UPI0009DCDBDB|nr:alpha/beta hydrolase [Sphingopyxis sp. MWB1]
MARIPLNIWRSIKLAAMASLCATLAACATGVEYGGIRHSAYVAEPRCAPQPGGNVDGATLPLFVATTRLPDCRTDAISLLRHRGDRMRFGRFAPPREEKVGKKKQTILPIAFQEESAWWRALQSETDKRRGRVLLYVHGYRETFETTARDTGQIARMTGFEGAIVNYSWPSQGDLLGYAVDETNMYHDVRNFRNFIKKLAEQPWVKEIIIVSHSLGARLVVPAIAYVDREAARADSGNISNIILASPDFDTGSFVRDIGADVLGPRRVASGRHVTAYVSRKDRALAASRTLHGYPRLGSPFCFDPFEAEELEKKGLPVRCYVPEIPGLTIVDTTEVSRGSTGHSNYLRSAVVCRDFIDVVAGKRQRAEREATHLPHVFRLTSDDNAPKERDREICRREGGEDDD